MPLLQILSLGLGAAFMLLVQLVPVQAQATRTWVSGVGDDANPCTRTAPCKTFGGTISKTAAGGQISVLDSGGFGTVTITKSMSIISEGAEGSVLAASVNGIIVNAGPNDVVNLHGLFIEGAQTGLNGIRFLGGSRLHIRNCVIRGFKVGTGLAIDVQAVGGRIFVSDCTLADNVGGVFVQSSTNSLIVTLDNVILEGNSAAAVRVNGAKAVVRLNRSTITNNGRGLISENNGKIQSYGNNVVHGNSPDGVPTEVIPLE